MSLAETLLSGSPYASYAYSYPHKTAYRPLEPPVPLGPLWAAERRDALFLYIHVPFCGMRCGFCNLFTKARPQAELVEGYLGALERQAARTVDELGEATFARLAIGGGTPTYLDLADLEVVLDVAERTMGADLGRIPGSVEVSPGTVDAEKLALLRARGLDRVSIGVESFDEAEAAAVYRPQQASVVERALGLIREAGFPTLNIDLIYGLPGQTVASWLASVRRALRFAPEELYLYPLYVRPLTGLGRRGGEWDDLRLACYREARALLIGEGYAQESMRMFRARTRPPRSVRPIAARRTGWSASAAGRDPTRRRLHYATEYAVGTREVGAIIAAYAVQVGIYVRFRRLRVPARPGGSPEASRDPVAPLPGGAGPGRIRPTVRDRGDGRPARTGRTGAARARGAVGGRITPHP